MSRTPALEMRRLEAAETPGHAEVRAKAAEFVARRGITLEAFADLVGIGDSSVKMWIRDAYDSTSPTPRSTIYLDARIWIYITRHWPEDDEASPEPLLETKGYQTIRECIEQAAEAGANSLIYGPPSSEKSFIAEQIAARYRAAGRRDVIYVQVRKTNYSGLSILRDIARKAEVWVRGSSCTPYLDALIEEFRSREMPPAIVVDEAQCLRADVFDDLRLGLHETTKRNRPDGSRRGCGLVFLGSHTLYSFFMHPARRFRFEQFLSRQSYRVQLTGMSADEALEIAARALGSGGKKAKLPPATAEQLLAECRVVDPYATNAEGEPLRDAAGKPIVRTYYSPRRLLERIRQSKRAQVSRVLAEAVA